MKCCYNLRVLTFLICFIICVYEIKCHFIPLHNSNLIEQKGYKPNQLHEAKNDEFQNLIEHIESENHLSEVKRQKNFNLFSELTPICKYSQTNINYKSWAPTKEITLNGDKQDKKVQSNNQIFGLKFTQKIETCVHKVQNEIALLFEEDLDVAKSIFPICCKNETKNKLRATTCLSVSKTKPLLCSSTKNKHPTRPATLVNTSPEILITSKTTNIYNHVSAEAVVNVVIHVKCDHPHGEAHLMPNTAAEPSPSNFSVPTNSLEPFLKVATTEAMRYLNCTSRSGKEAINLIKCIKPTWLENDNPETLTEQNEVLEKKILNDDLKEPPPQPFLPIDMTDQFTNSTLQMKLKTYAMPLFICQLTPSLCKTNTTTMMVSTTRSNVESDSTSKSKKAGWPHFWQRSKSSESQTKVTATLQCKPRQSTLDISAQSSTTPESVANCTTELDSEECDTSIEVSTTMECDTQVVSPVTDKLQFEDKKEMLVTPLLSKNMENFLPSEFDKSNKISTTELVQQSFVSDLQFTKSGDIFSDDNIITKEYFQQPAAPTLPLTENVVSMPEPELTTEFVSFTEVLTLTEPISTSSKFEDSPSLHRFPTSEYISATEPILLPLTESASSPSIIKTNTELPGSLTFLTASEPIGIALQTEPEISFKSIVNLSTELASTETLVSTNLVTTLPIELLSVISNQTSSTEMFDLLPNDKYYNTSPMSLEISYTEISLTPGKINSFSQTLGNSGEPTHKKGFEEEQGSLEHTEGGKEGVFSQDRISFTAPCTKNDETQVELGLTSRKLLSTGQSTEQSGLKGLTNEIVTGEATGENITVTESTIASTDEIVEHIVDLNNGSLMFYYKRRWFTTNNGRLWTFDNTTLETMNRTFFKVSADHIGDNNEANQKSIVGLLKHKNSDDDLEEIPFEVFAQSILKVNAHIAENAIFEWSGLRMNKSDFIAMLRLSSFDSSFGYEWGTANWYNIYNQVLESRKIVLDGKSEYLLSNGAVLVVYLDGSSFWNNKKLVLNETLNAFQQLNSKTEFSRKTVSSSYTSNDVSFISFVRHIFQQKTDLKVTYASYSWGKSSYSWEEILALLRMINSTTMQISDLENALSQYNWDEQLARLRSSQKHYFVDRTVYNINFGLETKSMTIFVNGSTDFDSKVVTLNDVNQKINHLQSFENSDVNIRHVISLGGGKYQFYWRGKWFVTDQTHVWAFEDRTSRKMNETFFKVPEITTVKLSHVRNLLENRLYQYYEMPFEVFSESMLKTANYESHTFYAWGKYVLSYSDIIAMLRLSNFDTVNPKTPDCKWGQIDWHVIYEKIQSFSKTSSSERQAYKALDFDGTTYPLIVFSNGTSIWKHLEVTLEKSLVTLQVLNSNLDASEELVSSLYLSEDISFVLFLDKVIIEKVKNNIIYNYYTWKNFQFKWEDLEATQRILLHYYNQKIAESFSFSNVVLPVMHSIRSYYPNKVVFQIKYGYEVKPLILYRNGTSLYEGVRLDFVDTIKQLQAAKKSSSMVFKEDLESASAFSQTLGTTTSLEKTMSFSTTKEDLGTSSNPVSSSSDNLQGSKTSEIVTSGVTNAAGVLEKYDWMLLDKSLTLTVHYPVNLGGGIHQFYMNNSWYLTNGNSIWRFYGSNNNVLNFAVKWLDSQDVPDDHTLNVTTIQKLVDESFAKDFGELAMPYEVIMQHCLFFMKYRHKDVKSAGIAYKHVHADARGLSDEEVVLYMRVAAFNNFATPDVKIPWSNGQKINWKWVENTARNTDLTVTPLGMTFSFYNSELEGIPPVTIHSNGSSDWGDQRLDVDEALSKLQSANKHNTFMPLEIDEELTMLNESAPFEWLYKEALRRRFDNNQIYTSYKWVKMTPENLSSFSWLNLLIYVRFLELYEERNPDDAFWVKVLKVAENQKHYLDRIEYDITNIETNEKIDCVVFTNESTIILGKQMNIEDYRPFYH